MNLLFYALGNPGEKYANTRHNAGQIIQEYGLKKLGITLFKNNGYMYGKSGDIHMLRSTGYMNTSGEPLRKYLDYYKLSSEDTIIVVLQDDSDQTTSKNKLVQGGGSAGHKGINSINEHLLSTDFDPSKIYKYKIGIRPEHNKQRSETFVLKQYSKKDLEALKQTSDKFWTQANLNNLQSNRSDLVMNKVN